MHIAVQLGFVSGSQAADDLVTSAQLAIARIPNQYLMQMPVLAVMYDQTQGLTRGWQQQLSTSHVSYIPSHARLIRPQTRLIRPQTRRIRSQNRRTRPQPPRSTRHSLLRSQATASGPSGPSPVTPREPVPRQLGVPPSPMVMVRTEKQLNKEKFKKLREKRKDRKQRQANNTG